MSNPADYTIGWICATKAEWRAAYAVLDAEHDAPESISSNDSNFYTLGRIGEHNVAVTISHNGYDGISMAVARAAVDILHSFPNMKACLMVGIGGGAPTLKHDIRLGDVVVGAPRESDGTSGVFEYDFDQTIRDRSFQTTGFLAQPPALFKRAMNGLKAQYESDGHQIKEAINKILDKNPVTRFFCGRPEVGDKLYQSDVIHLPGDSSCAAVCGNDSDNLVLRPERTEGDGNPTVHYGLIASAKQELRDATVRDTLSMEKDALCFETGAAGLMKDFPCLVIRGICNYSDSHKNTDWKGYAAMAAAVYAKDLLYHISPGEIEADERIVNVLSGVQGAADDLCCSEEQAKLILNWLTPVEHATRQRDFIQSSETGTGRWLLESPEYQAFLNTNRQTLFCTGLPGAGKTFLTAIVIEDLLRKFRSSTATGIAYIYFTYRRPDEHQADALLASLLKQLSEGRYYLPSSVRDLYGRHEPTLTRPSLDEMSTALQSVATLYSQIFIIVDGLDECLVSDGHRERFLSEVFNFQTKNGAKLFATSRRLPEIEEHFENATKLEIRARDEDISRYMDSRQTRRRFSDRQHTKWHQKMRRAIRKLTYRMQVSIFKYKERIYLNLLCTVLTQKQPHAASTKLPTHHVLDHLHPDSVQRIYTQWPDMEEVVKEVLLWVVCSLRPLTLSELQHALAVNSGESEPDQEAADIISMCADFVAINESGIVHFLHSATQEYFKQTQQDWFPDADAKITTVCIKYLSFPIYNSGFCQTDEGFEERLQSSPLYDYAARYWGHHASGASFCSPAILDFLESEGNLEAASQAMMAVKPNGIQGHSNYTQAVPRQVTALHLVAYFGLDKIGPCLASRGHGLDSRDSIGRTPLSWAAEHGHDTTVKFFLENGVDFNSKDTRGRTPLHFGAKHGHGMIVKYLITAGAYIDALDERGSTALHESISGDHQTVQEFLMDRGADLDIKDQDGRTACDRAWLKKSLDWSAYMVADDLTKDINQGTQARCEVLRRIDGESPQVIFRKTFDFSSSEGKKGRKYLLREHKILQKLNHPFIVSYIGFKEDSIQKQASLYLEFCEGGDLRQRYVNSGDDSDDSDNSCVGDPKPVLPVAVPLQETEVWSIVFQLSAAIAYLHHGLSIKKDGRWAFERCWESVIHRDLKPANVILKAVENGRIVTKLCDLGLVKAVVGEKAQTKRIGTQDYSPPEVRRGKGWTVKGDIYSLGATVDDLLKQSEPQGQLRELLDQCKSEDQSLRPSSLSILERAREHVAAHEARLSVSLHELLGSGPGNYLLQSLVEIASSLDGYADFGNETRLRRQGILGRLELLCTDGAGDLFDKHSNSLHLSILLNRQKKLEDLLATGQKDNINEKWGNSGWTPLHLAFQESKWAMANLLIKYGADLKAMDKHRRQPEFYGPLAEHVDG